jgi:nucleotidyltransferase substrate binding protein (TIGR01987 family)
MLRSFGRMLLDLSSFHRALASLDRAAVRAEGAPADEELRDAVIQRFEYTYELAWRMLKRHLEQVVPDPARVDGLSFRELIREGAERGIIAEPEPWFEYRHQRNLTSHAYNSAAAQLVFQTALTFREAARTLLAELERRNTE